MTHFVSASCEGQTCSVCKAPATHKLGEEIPHDEPVPGCPDCHRTWRMLDASAQADKPWRRQCAHCGDSHPYTDDEDDIDECPACGAEASPISFQNCGNFAHSVVGPARHNLTAYVCCAHFTMIVGTASGCPIDRCAAWRIPGARVPWTIDTAIPAVALQCVLARGHAGEHAHPSFTIGPITIVSERQSVLFKDAVAISKRAMTIHNHGTSQSALALVVFDLAELVAAIARGDK